MNRESGRSGRLIGYWTVTGFLAVELIVGSGRCRTVATDGARHDEAGISNVFPDYSRLVEDRGDSCAAKAGNAAGEGMGVRGHLLCSDWSSDIACHLP